MLQIFATKHIDKMLKSTMRLFLKMSINFSKMGDPTRPNTSRLQVFHQTTRPVRHEGRMTWIIEDTNVLKFEECIKSKIMNFITNEDEYLFFLILKNKGEAFIGISISVEEVFPDKMSFCFKAVDSLGVTIESGTLLKLPSVSEDDFVLDISEFLAKNRLKVNGDADRSHGTSLKIICDFTIYEAVYSHKVESQVDDVKLGSGIFYSLGSVLSDGFLSDFIIRCDGQEFKTHKVVLAARSTYFKSIFSHTTLENQENFVEIKDASAETLASFLEYVYTNKLSKAAYTTELLTLSDRFQFTPLKDECEAVLSENVDLSNAISLLSIAHICSAKLLTEKVSSFVRQNRSTLVETADWKDLVKSNPAAMEALFRF